MHCQTMYAGLSPRFVLICNLTRQFATLFQGVHSSRNNKHKRDRIRTENISCVIHDEASCKRSTIATSRALARCASCIAMIRCRCETNQANSTLNPKTPNNSVNNMIPSILMSPSGLSTDGYLCNERHSTTLKCTNGISKTSSNATTDERRARC